MTLHRMTAIEAERQRQKWQEEEMLHQAREAYPNITIIDVSVEGCWCERCRYDGCAVYLTPAGYKCAACLMDYAR